MIWVIFGLFCVLVIRLAYQGFRMLNPYKLNMVFGKKGSGKSTYMTKLAVRYYKKGWKVFSNTQIAYATQIDIRTLGEFVPPNKSVLLVDEVGMIWDNRDYKNFKTYVRDYFKYQRHYRNIVYLFSQTFDIDIKLRTLTDAMYLVTAPFPFLSVIRKIKRRIVLVQPVADMEGRIADSLEFVPWIANLFGAKALQFTYIPNWVKYFDSYEVPPLPEYKYNPYIPDVPQSRVRHIFGKLGLHRKSKKEKPSNFDDNQD